MLGWKQGGGAVFAALVFCSAQAHAEVCDKMWPDWDPANGTVSQLDDIVFTFGSVPGLIFVGLVAVALLLRNKWFCLLVASLSALLAVVVIGDWFVFDRDSRFRESAIAEGCLVPPYAIGAILLSTTLLCLLLAFEASLKSKAKP